MTDNATVEMIVVRHLADIEGAVHFLENALQPKFDGAVGALLAEWSEPKGWSGDFDPNSDEYFWLAPQAWRTLDGEEDEHDFWFILEPIWGEADEEDTTSLASFIGASARGNRRALSLKQDALKKRAWQALLGSSDELLQKLRDLGFETDTRAGRISFPIELNGALLGQALADDDFGEALQPLSLALAKVGEALPLFDELAAAARTAA